MNILKARIRSFIHKYKPIKGKHHISRIYRSQHINYYRHTSDLPWQHGLFLGTEGWDDTLWTTILQIQLIFHSGCVVWSNNQRSRRRLLRLWIWLRWALSPLKGSIDQRVNNSTHSCHNDFDVKTLMNFYLIFLWISYSRVWGLWGDEV